MATITGLTADRMVSMENATIIDGTIEGDNLVLERRDGGLIVTGSVRGPQGIPGASFILCTSTTRPTGYTVGDAGKAIYETDTGYVRIWTGTRFKLQEKIICTSTTRPAGLVAADEGVKIYETDTNLEFTWSGTSWLLANSYVATFSNATTRGTLWPTPPEGALSYLTDTAGIIWLYSGGAWHSGAALGRVASTTVVDASANGSGDTPVDVPGMSVSWTAVAGRRYKITVHGHTYSSVMGDVGFWVVTDNGNAVKNTVNTIAQSTTLAQMFEYTYDETGLSGSIVRKLRFYPPTAGGILQFFADTTRKAFIRVEDDGV